jgi:hypothetical protein
MIASETIAHWEKASRGRTLFGGWGAAAVTTVTEATLPRRERLGSSVREPRFCGRWYFMWDTIEWTRLRRLHAELRSDC